MAFRIEAYALTDVGLMREHNEDAFDVLGEQQIYVVADGMGGHASGQVASRLSVENLRLYATELVGRPGHEYTFPVLPGASETERMLSNAIQWSNERIFIESMKDRKFEGMGTTIVATAVDGDKLVLGHVGDSRIYRYRDGLLTQVTRDHSLLNHYIDQGKITTEDEARNFRERNIIVKALGLKDYVEPTVQSTDIQLGDVYLLCTDGLTDQVEDWIIANVLDGNDDLAEACQALIRLANEAGGKDNCTVMLLRVWDAASAPVEEGTQPSMPAMVEPEDEAEEATAPDLPAMPDELDEGPETAVLPPLSTAAPAPGPPPIPSAARTTLKDLPDDTLQEVRDAAEARKRVRTTVPLGMPAVKVPIPRPADGTDTSVPLDVGADFDDSDFNFDDRIDE